MAGYGDEYQNLDDAAQAALMWLSHQPEAIQQEYMAYLYRTPQNTYVRGPFITSGLEGKIEAPKPDKSIGEVVGYGHIHPGVYPFNTPANDNFSINDHNTAISYTPKGKPIIAAYLTHMQKRGVPVDRVMTPYLKSYLVPNPNTGKDAPVKAYQGEPFLAQFPIHEHRQYLIKALMHDRNMNDPRGLYIGDPSKALAMAAAIRGGSQ